MKKFTTMLVLAFVFCANSLFAQTRQVSGTVVSAGDNEPIIGATVVIQGTTNGGVTDANGKYTVSNVNGAVSFQVSYLGYKTQIMPVAVSVTKLNITMESDALAVDEVVITGLGISREKKALGYAVQDLGAEDINAAGNPSVVSSLQGKLSGVEIKPSSGMPGASSQIIIRGARSFTGNNQPLYVVDGMPIASGSDRNTLNSTDGTDFANRSVDIDPSDIESMTILKGQAASALYGIRASNGVVVITTKSGKSNKNGRVNVSFSNTTSMDVNSRNTQAQKTWAQGTYFGYSPNSSMSWGPKISDLPNSTSKSGSQVLGGNNAGQPGKFYVPQLAQAGLDPWQTPQAFDNIGDFYQTGYTTSTAASVSQSKDGYNYYVGLNNTKQEGIIASTGMVRTGARINADTKLGKSWRTGFSGNYTQSTITKAAGANDALIATILGAPSSYNMKGYPTHTEDPYTQLNYRANSFNNAYWAMDNDYFGEKTNRFYGNTFVEFAPDYGWSHNQKISFKYQVGVDTYTTQYDDIREYMSRNTKGSIENWMVNSNTYNSLLTATYNIDITPDFKLDLMLGNELNHNNYYELWSKGQNFNFGGWANLANATIKDGGDTSLKDRTFGLFANLNLSYKNMLFLGATVRNDIVSIMPRDNRSFTYPSVSLGYIFTEHKGLKNSSVLNFGKVRASYAEVGQAARYYQDFYRTPTYGGGFWSYPPITYPVNGSVAYNPYGRLYDPNLKPQNTISYEAGLDLRMFNNILELSYTFSRQNVKDQIFPVPLAASTGYADKLMNGGKIHTNVHEIFATVNILKKKDWDWSVTANFTKMDNYVDELAPGVESIMLGGFVTPQVRAGIGAKFPVIYGESFLKDDQGRVLIDEDPESWSYGMPMPGGPDVIASVSPNFILGFGTTLRWKDIILRATFDWKNGGHMYSGSNGLMNLYGTSIETEDRVNTFIAPGYLSNGQPNNISRGGKDDLDAYQDYWSSAMDIDEAYIRKSDFVKLREINIAYKIKAYKTFNIGVNVFARNILIWTAMPNFDPESSQGNNNMGGAFERFSLPQTSSYGLGLNLTF